MEVFNELLNRFVLNFTWVDGVGLTGLTGMCAHGIIQTERLINPLRHQVRQLTDENLGQQAFIDMQIERIIQLERKVKELEQERKLWNDMLDTENLYRHN